VIAPVPFLAAAVKSIGTLRPWLAAAARELGKLIDSQHGVPSPVLCETCTIVRPRITSAEAQALIAPRRHAQAPADRLPDQRLRRARPAAARAVGVPP
jgi:hypothetical protein